MKIRKIAAIALLVFGSLGAESVAPSKAELETMYDGAFRAFEGSNYPEALKQLDAMDARQPDVAESQNLRGVIYMRQGLYDKAETALLEALRINPKFWNARFNLAEVPFLKKDWTQARDRFQQLLSSNASELEDEAKQLIQYKILLTQLLDGKENMVDSILAKFELSPNTPAVHYANAAIALFHKNTAEAQDWIGAAQKNFSPQLNKLFSESLYEVGWLEKQTGQSRAALELTSAADRAAKAKGVARANYEEAQASFQKGDLSAALKLAEAADAADPNQPGILNLRGEILMERQNFEEAETVFRKALKVDPKFREAQYNLAQIPFKKKDYAKARERFEGLFGQTPGGDKNQAAQLIKFKIYMTLLLEGKDSRAQKMMEQFQFTGDTPALYYAQAAWEFKQNNPTKANDWVASAKKIYSPALNVVFADSFYDLGWMQSAAASATAAPAGQEAALASTSDGGPAIEPSPIPAVASAGSKSSASASSPVISGMEATAPDTSAMTPFNIGPGLTSNELTAAGTPAKPEDVPGLTGSETSVAAASPAASVTITTTDSRAASSPAPAAASPAPALAASSPATNLAPARIREVTPPTIGERLDGWLQPQALLVGALALVGIGLLASVFIPEIRRRVSGVSVVRRPQPAMGPRLEEVRTSAPEAPSSELTAHNRLVGGPRQVSLHLKASEPSLRRAVVPVGKVTRPGENEPQTFAEPVQAIAPEETVLEESSVGPVFEQPMATPPMPASFEEQFAPAPAAMVEPAPVEMAAAPVEMAPLAPIAEVAPPAPPPREVAPAMPEMAPQPVLAQAPPPPDVSDFEPITQGQPVPHQMPAFPQEVEEPPTRYQVISEPRPARMPEPLASGPAIAGVGALRPTMVETPSFAPRAVSTEPSAPQITTHETMPEPTQTPTSPVLRTPTADGHPQASGAMQTAVQLTFSFEIASMQLTSTFKMGALQLRPISKIVTMRLAPAQHPQPAMNLQVTFEIAKVQPAGGGLGMIRLIPSQQQRPPAISSSSFSIAGLQLVSNFEAAPVQLTPSQQGQASVLLTAGFQIATVEFSPSFDIASLVLNSNSSSVSVQLPGAGAGDNAPMFDIANLQVGSNGEIALVQLAPAGAGAAAQKR